MTRRAGSGGAAAAERRRGGRRPREAAGKNARPAGISKDDRTPGAVDGPAAAATMRAMEPVSGVTARTRATASCEGSSSWASPRRWPGWPGRCRPEASSSSATTRRTSPTRISSALAARLGDEARGLRARVRPLAAADPRHRAASAALPRRGAARQRDHGSARAAHPARVLRGRARTRRGAAPGDAARAAFSCLHRRRSQEQEYAFKERLRDGGEAQRDPRVHRARRARLTRPRGGPRRGHGAPRDALRANSVESGS